MNEKRRPDLSTVPETLNDLSVSRNVFPKGEMLQFSATGPEELSGENLRLELLSKSHFSAKYFGTGKKNAEYCLVKIWALSLFLRGLAISSKWELHYVHGLR